MWSDPIADMLTRIRNAVRTKRREVKIPSSKLKVGVAQVLKEEGYVLDYDVIDDGRQGILRITLKYGPHGEQIINEIDRKSKSGCRVYRGCKDLPRVMDGLGIAIISTSRGVMSDRQCREKNVGGELICTVC
jgi:small subunit ribosomal protein S8